ncbi:SCO family protein [Algoriphagus aquimarinus]|uniref:SCO family protein n=1 Tax=Algoriphagus aquimarinus TaxID=237018 RepID=UPI0030DA7221|tara:strand:+ start:166833 stop:167516 length:684 start_codon:yes stop_codon:yes gene_type:complete
MTRLTYIFLVLLTISCSEKSVNTSSVSESTAETSIDKDQLPYYQEATFTPEWYSSAADLPENYHRIPEFSFQNQQGLTISDKDMEGKIYVVDFFFTTCPGICPKMTGNMSLVQEAFKDDNQVQLLSHSVTPDFDDVSVLNEYAKEHGVEAGKWHLLTGDRDQIYEMARNQYFVEEDLGLLKNPDEFLHTENFILIDTNRHIRGIYNGLNKTSVSQLIADIKTLKVAS